MEGLLFLVIQLMIQAVLGMTKLLCMFAIVFGRLLAMLLPVVFRAVAALVRALVDLFAGRREPNRPSYQETAGYPSQRTSFRARPRDGRLPSAPLSYRRRYTVDNFWRSGDR